MPHTLQNPAVGSGARDRRGMEPEVSRVAIVTQNADALLASVRSLV
jgi:hypothetical protein